MNNAAQHLALETIWDFAKFETRPSSPEFAHLLNCEECVSILGLCQLYDSIAKVQQRLNDRDGLKTSAAK